jgi:hypothetical protein
MATFTTPHVRSDRMTRRLRALAAAAALLAGCSADRLTVPNFNESSTAQAPDRPLIQNLASGIVAEQRSSLLGLVSNVGIFGRESYLYTSSEPRNTTLFLGQFPLDNSGFTNGQWVPRFRNVRNALNLVQIADGVTFLSDGEKNAVRGFANTMFRQFNRGIAARVLVYRGTLDCGATCFTAALAALGESFLNAAPTADLRRGVYHTFSTASGDQLNTLSIPVTPDQLAHPSIRPDAQRQANGTPDARVGTKIRTIATRNAPGGITVGIPTDAGFSFYPDQTTPVPIIRNEELILLRAEANIGLNQLAAALPDINYIRTTAGLLPALGGFANRDAAIDALLYEKRYSLLWEGHRWFDVRRWGRLETLPLDIPTHFRVRVMPVPQAECLARAALPADLNLKGKGCP